MPNTNMKEFTSELIRETAYNREELGPMKCRMTLTPIKSTFTIIWEAGTNDPSDGEEYAEIGIWTEGNKVTEYDGVFSLPIEALELLRDNGYDTTEVE